MNRGRVERASPLAGGAGNGVGGAVVVAVPDATAVAATRPPASTPPVAAIGSVVPAQRAVTPLQEPPPRSGLRSAATLLSGMPPVAAAGAATVPRVRGHNTSKREP
jgi:hypothetical protein